VLILYHVNSKEGEISLEINQDELLAKLFCRAMTELIFQPSLAVLGDDDLTGVQFDCLRYVYLHHEPSVGAVADGLRISKAASTKLIHRLVLKGLLERREDPSDRRLLKLILTPAGQALIEKIQAVQTERFERLTEQMAEDDREALERGMTGFLKAGLRTKEDVDRICLHCGWLHLPSCAGNQVYQRLTGQDKESK
jgi:DNA-binding MarR family transcriptional regulator